jgi:hypothetical protein
VYIARNHVTDFYRPLSPSRFSGPWIRATLLNTPAYVASDDFMAHVQWSDAGAHNDLVIAKAPNDPNVIASEPATCAIVGTVSRNKIFLEPHSNYNPNFEKTALETSKMQFQLVCPTAHPEFVGDFDRGVARIESLQKLSIKEGPNAQHFVVSDGLKKALKFSSPLFEKRVRRPLIQFLCHN